MYAICAVICMSLMLPILKLIYTYNSNVLPAEALFYCGFFMLIYNIIYILAFNNGNFRCLKVEKNFR
jgi:hypothetical protein